MLLICFFVPGPAKRSIWFHLWGSYLDPTGSKCGSKYETLQASQCQCNPGHCFIRLHWYIQPEQTWFQFNYSHNDQRLAANALMQLTAKEGWGNLPDRAQATAKEMINRQFPAHYRQAVEEYLKRIAQRPAPDLE